MDGVFTNLMLGFSVAMQPSVLAYAFAGCVIGTLVGMLPGLGPLAGISLLLPATFGLNPIVAIVLLAGVYYGAMYGGSTTSILMRIPGEAEIELASLKQRDVLVAATGVPGFDVQGRIDLVDRSGEGRAIDGEASARRGGAEQDSGLLLR